MPARRLSRPLDRQALFIETTGQVVLLAVAGQIAQLMGRGGDAGPSGRMCPLRGTIGGLRTGLVTQAPADGQALFEQPPGLSIVLFILGDATELMQYGGKLPRHPRALVNLLSRQVVLPRGSQVTLPSGQDAKLVLAVGDAQVITDLLSDSRALLVQLAGLVIVALVTGDDGQVVQDVGNALLIVDRPSLAPPAAQIQERE